MNTNPVDGKDVMIPRRLKPGEQAFIKEWLTYYRGEREYDHCRFLCRIIERDGVLPSEERRYYSLCPF